MVLQFWRRPSIRASSTRPLELEKRQLLSAEPLEFAQIMSDRPKATNAAPLTPSHSSLVNHWKNAPPQSSVHTCWHGGEGVQ